MKDRKGIALILAVGILALLAVIATSFALNMRLEYKAATNYYNGVRARYLSEAALQRAIAELKKHVASSAFDDLSETWAMASSFVNTDGSLNSSESVETKSVIKDEQRKININNANTILLTNIIGSSLFGGGIPGARTVHIVSAIEDARPFNDIEEIKQIYPFNQWDDNTNTFSYYESLEQYITVHSYEDPNNSNRSPININTAKLEVLESVLNGIVSNYVSLSKEIYNRIRGIGIKYPRANPFTSWSEFDSFIDSLVGGVISDTEASLVKNNCNPNRIDDKSTTEFCFNSGGYYEITGTSAISNTAASTPQQTVYKVKAIVKVYDIYNQTTTTQFEAGTPERVTWLDSCPVESDEVFGGYSQSLSNATTIPGSIKLGFWDDFEDPAYSASQWNIEGTSQFLSGKFQLWTWAQSVLNGDTAGQAWTGDTGFSSWDDYSLRAVENDMVPSGNESTQDMENVGWVFLRSPIAGKPVALHAKTGLLSWNSGYYAYQDPNVAAQPGEVIFLTDTQANDYDPPLSKHIYPNQIRVFRDLGEMSNENDDIEGTYRTQFTYEQQKAYNISVKDTSLEITVFNSSGSGTFSSSISTTPGVIGFYSQANIVQWDDVRIISPSGTFTSQAFTPPAGAKWGTIVSTITLPDSAAAALDTSGQPASVTATLETSTDGGNTWMAPAAETPEKIPNTGGASIQYRATLTTNDANIQETPVLEDVTITYMPKIKVISYSIPGTQPPVVVQKLPPSGSPITGGLF